MVPRHRVLNSEPYVQVTLALCSLNFSFRKWGKEKRVGDRDDLHNSFRLLWSVLKMSTGCCFDPISDVYLFNLEDESIETFDPVTNI